MNEINRHNYDISHAFPQVHDYPMYAEPDPNVAVLVRLFAMNDDLPELSHKFIHLGLWSMRSHMLNTDMCEYKPSVIFHIEDRLYQVSKHVFDEAGVPTDNIIVFPDDLCLPSKSGAAQYKAVAPLIDPQLERFDRVIVIDADVFSVADDACLIPLMDISLNKLPPDETVWLRTWTKWEPQKDEYKYWHDASGLGKDGFIERAAKYCNTTPGIINGIFYPMNGKTQPRPFHNGAYINTPTRILLDNPEFREILWEVSGTLGNEEIAIAIWAIRYYLKTGKLFPRCSFQDYIYKEDPLRFRMDWALHTAWETYEKHAMPSLVHLYGFNNITEYIHRWARSIRASDEEIAIFADKVSGDINQLTCGEDNDV